MQPITPPQLLTLSVLLLNLPSGLLAEPVPAEHVTRLTPLASSARPAVERRDMFIVADTEPLALSARSLSLRPRAASFDVDLLPPASLLRARSALLSPRSSKGGHAAKKAGHVGKAVTKHASGGKSQGKKGGDGGKVQAHCHTVRADVGPFSNVAYTYTIEVHNWPKDRGGCGKGLLDNIRGQCRGESPTDWGCDQLGPGHLRMHFTLPKINIYNCVENGIKAASYNKVWTKCEGIANPAADAALTGVELGSMVIPGPEAALGVAGHLAADGAMMAAKAGARAAGKAAAKGVTKQGLQTGHNKAKAHHDAKKQARGGRH